MAIASISINCSINKIFVVTTQWTTNQTITISLRTPGGSVLQTVTGNSSGGAYVGEMHVADGSYRLVVTGSVDGDITLQAPYNGVFPVACGINANVTINCSTNKVIVATSGWPSVQTVTVKLLAPSNTELQTVSGSSLNGVYTGEFVVAKGFYKISVSGSTSGSATVRSPYNGIFEVSCATACDLLINHVAVVNDVNSQGKGKITVSATSSYPIEYSLNNTVFQSSNVFNTNITPGTYTVYLRDSNQCTVKKSNVVVGNTACSLTITSLSKTDETGADLNNGTITVSASSPVGGVMYNIDGGTYYNSGVFTGIPPGVHTVYVKDSANCFITQNVTINEVVAIPVPSICINPDLLEIPKSLPYRFITTRCNPADYVEDNILYNEEEIDGVNKTCFFQLLSCNDVLTLQIRYSEAAFKTKPILEIREFEDDELITRIPFINVNSDYWQLEKNINEVSGICEKVVYLVIKSYLDTTSPATYLYDHAKSEPIHVSNFHDTTLVLEYWNDEDYINVNYEDVEYRNKMRVYGQFWQKNYPQEKMVYEKSNGEIVKLRETIKEQIKLRIGYIPSYLHEKIALALSHDHIRINGVEYVSEENYSFEYLDKYALTKGEAVLSNKNYQRKNLIK